MKEEEMLGLICLVYDYKPLLKETNVKLVYEEREIYPISIIHQVNVYLKRKGYFSEDGRPTLKMYKLLAKYNIKIKSLEEYQKEFDETGHVTQIDKFGNKEIL